jgi:hypothetical protein
MIPTAKMIEEELNAKPLKTYAVLNSMLGRGNGPMFSQAEERFHQGVKELKAASISYYSRPLKKAHLGSLLAEAEKTDRAIMNLLNVAQAPDDRRAVLVKYRQYMSTDLKFLRAVAHFDTPSGKDEVRRILDTRFQNTGGVQLTAITTKYVNECLDPLHRWGKEIEGEFKAWVERQRDQNLDPGENLVDFLLEFHLEHRYKDSRCFNDKQLGFLQLTFSEPRPGDAESRLCSLFVTAKDGKVRYNPLNAVHNKAYQTIRREAFDTTGGRQVRDGHDLIGGSTYVLSPDGKLHCGAADTIHSTYMAGGRVQAAGLLVVKTGKVLIVDNYSGHYEPNWKNLYQMVSLLASKGVLDSSAVISMVVDPSTHMFFAIEDFLRLGSKGFLPEDVADVVRSYHRKYQGKVPVPSGKLQFIPEARTNGWSDENGRAWHQFLKAFCQTTLVPAGVATAAKAPVPSGWVPSQPRVQTQTPAFA